MVGTPKVAEHLLVCQEAWGGGAAWRVKALLHRARMLKRLRCRSDGEQRPAGRGVDARRGQVSSGFKREAIPTKNHDAQSFIRWIHVLILGACPGFRCTW